MVCWWLIDPGKVTSNYHCTHQSEANENNLTADDDEGHGQQGQGHQEDQQEGLEVWTELSLESYLVVRAVWAEIA